MKYFTFPVRTTFKEKRKKCYIEKRKLIRKMNEFKEYFETFSGIMNGINISKYLYKKRLFKASCSLYSVLNEN